MTENADNAERARSIFDQLRSHMTSSDSSTGSEPTEGEPAGAGLAEPPETSGGGSDPQGVTGIQLPEPSISADQGWVETYGSPDAGATGEERTEPETVSPPETAIPSPPSITEAIEGPDPVTARHDVADELAPIAPNLAIGASSSGSEEAPAQPDRHDSVPARSPEPLGWAPPAPVAEASGLPTATTPTPQAPHPPEPVTASISVPHQPLVARVAAPPDLDEALRAATNQPLSDDDGNGRTGLEHLPVDEYGRPRHPGSVAHSLPRIMAIANQKGGVGKTTTTVNLGASLAELGYRVLVIDLDPQGNATTGLGVNARNLDASVYDVILHDTPVEDVIEPTTMRNLFVVPATIDLAGAEIELVPVFSRELRLRRSLESVEGDFDFLLIDCPPSLGLLTVNALAAAGEVLVPIQCEYYALEGLSQLLRNVNLVKSNLNDRLEVSTIVLTMYDARTKLAEQVAEEVRQHFGARVCRNVVPRTVRLSEAPSFGQPVTTFDPSSRGAIAYRELAKEVSGGAPQRIR
jgi:chromosome partitioning protein